MAVGLIFPPKLVAFLLPIEKTKSDTLIFVRRSFTDGYPLLLPSPAAALFIGFIVSSLPLKYCRTDRLVATELGRRWKTEEKYYLFQLHTVCLPSLISAFNCLI